MRSALMVFAFVCLASVVSAAPPPLPPGDRPGSSDSPILTRFDESIILQYEKKNLDELTLPLSKLKTVPGKRNSGNNAVAEPKTKKTVEGETTHLLYVTPTQRTSLEVMKHYKDQIATHNGKVLYECKAAECGGNSEGNSLDGGGSMSLAMYLRGAERIDEKPWSVPYCASKVKLSDIRYVTAELPGSGAYVSVMAANFSDVGDGCSALKGRSMAMVDVVAVAGKAPAGRK